MHSLARTLLPSFVLLFNVHLLHAATKTWDGGGADDLFTTGANWNANTAPDFSSPDSSNPADDIVLAGSIRLTPSIPSNITVQQITFSADAGAFTIGGAGIVTVRDATSSGVGNNTGNITNNSSNTQTISASLSIRGGTIGAAVAPFVFGGNINVGAGNNTATSRNVTVNGTFDTTFQGILQGNGTNGSAGGALVKGGSGTLYLNADSSAWNGRIELNGGVLVPGHANALGSTAGGIEMGNGTSSGRLSLVGGITFAPEPMSLSGRNANLPAILNSGDSNVWTGPITLTTGGSLYGFRSDAGFLEISGNLSGGTTTGTRTLNLGGVADGKYSGSIQNGTATLGIVKEGAGTWTLSGDDPYTGPTSVTAGSLVIGGSLSATNAVSVKNGTLELASDHRLNDNATLTLESGVFDTGGFSETVLALSLLSSSSIDLGNGASILHFGDSSASIWAGTLSVLAWSGNISGNGLDAIFFGASASGIGSNLAAIQFIDPLGFDPGVYGAAILSSGEIIPVPEPNGFLSLFGALGALAGLRRLRLPLQ